MGPLISRTARERVEDAIARARKEGAQLLTGGKRPASLGRGHFLEPAVLDRVRHGTTPTKEEISKMRKAFSELEKI